MLIVILLHQWEYVGDVKKDVFYDVLAVKDVLGAKVLVQVN